MNKISHESPKRGPADPELGGISCVFPVHNESFIIEQTIRNYFAELSGRVADLEMIVAEDGSTDDTKVVLERLAKDLPIRVFMSDERKGYQQAVIDAVSHATKPWVFIVDSLPVCRRGFLAAGTAPAELQSDSGDEGSPARPVLPRFPILGL